MIDPLNEIFTKKTFKEMEEEIKMLKEGISNEIDNLREELNKIKKRNNFLEKQAVDYQENFRKDRILFSEQLKEIEELKKGEKEGCGKLFDDDNRICGDIYAYRRMDERPYVKNKTSHDIWLCSECSGVRE